jgi:hypothetical protein
LLQLLDTLWILRMYKNSQFWSTLRREDKFIESNLLQFNDRIIFIN